MTIQSVTRSPDTCVFTYSVVKLSSGTKSSPSRVHISLVIVLRYQQKFFLSLSPSDCKDDKYRKFVEILYNYLEV